jgi:hypothetical protein
MINLQKNPYKSKWNFDNHFAQNKEAGALKTPCLFKVAN